MKYSKYLSSEIQIKKHEIGKLLPTLAEKYPELRLKQTGTLLKILRASITKAKEERIDLGFSASTISVFFAEPVLFRSN